MEVLRVEGELDVWKLFCHMFGAWEKMTWKPSSAGTADYGAHTSPPCDWAVHRGATGELEFLHGISTLWEWLSSERSGRWVAFYDPDSEVILQHFCHSLIVQEVTKLLLIQKEEI